MAEVLITSSIVVQQDCVFTASTSLLSSKKKTVCRLVRSKATAAAILDPTCDSLLPGGGGYLT